MDPVAFDTLLISHASATGMVITRERLRALGASQAAITRRVSAGMLLPLGDGVFGIAGAKATTYHQRLAAAVQQRPHSALAYETAAVLHRVPGIRSDHACHLLVPITHSARSPIGTIHRTKHLPDCDVTTIDSLPVTTLERTFCDLASTRSLAFLRWLGEELLLGGRMERRALSSCASGLNRRGRKGSTMRRQLMLHLCDDSPVVSSVAEARFVELCGRFGIRELTSQLRPPWYDGRSGIVDFGNTERRTIVEVDGLRWHASTQALREDRRRDRLATQHGWNVVRFSYDEIVTRPGLVASEVLGLLTPP